MARDDVEGSEPPRPREPWREAEGAWPQSPDVLRDEFEQRLVEGIDRIGKEIHRALDRHAEQTTEVVRAEVERVHDELASGFSERLKNIESTLGSSIGDIREIDDSVRASRVEVRNLRSRLDGVASSVVEVRAALSRLSSSREFGESDAETLEEIRVQLAQTLTPRIEALNERLESVGSLEEGFERLTALSETIENLVSRSGLHELKRAHDQLSEQQTDLVERLEAAGHRFEGTVGTLEERIDGIRSRTDEALAEIRADNARSAEQMQSEVTEAVTSLSTDITGGLERLKEQMELLAGPRSDIQAIRAEISEVEGRLATAIQQLDGRLAREAEDQKTRVGDLTRGTATQLQSLTEVFEAATKEVRKIESQLHRLEDAADEPRHPPPNDVP